MPNPQNPADPAITTPPANPTPPADPNADGGNNQTPLANPNPADEGGKGGAELKYSDADVDELFKKKFAQKRAQMEREIRDSIAKEEDDKRTEAEKLANMTELQRAQYEAKQLKAEKEALEAERDLSQQMAIARHELSEAGINMPDELLSMFVSSEAEKTSAAIDALKELMPKFVNDAVQEKLKRTPPPAETQQGGKSFAATFAENYSKQKNGGND